MESLKKQITGHPIRNISTFMAIMILSVLMNLKLSLEKDSNFANIGVAKIQQKAAEHGVNLTEQQIAQIKELMIYMDEGSWDKYFEFMNTCEEKDLDAIVYGLQLWQRVNGKPVSESNSMLPLGLACGNESTTSENAEKMTVPALMYQLRHSFDKEDMQTVTGAESIAVNYPDHIASQNFPDVNALRGRNPFGEWEYSPVGSPHEFFYNPAQLLKVLNDSITDACEMIIPPQPVPDAEVESVTNLSWDAEWEGYPFKMYSCTYKFVGEENYSLDSDSLQAIFHKFYPSFLQDLIFDEDGMVFNRRNQNGTITPFRISGKGTYTIFLLWPEEELQSVLDMEAHKKQLSNLANLTLAISAIPVLRLSLKLYLQMLRLRKVKKFKKQILSLIDPEFYPEDETKLLQWLNAIKEIIAYLKKENGYNISEIRDTFDINEEQAQSLLKALDKINLITKGNLHQAGTITRGWLDKIKAAKSTSQKPPTSPEIPIMPAQPRHTDLQVLNETIPEDLLPTIQKFNRWLQQGNHHFLVRAHKQYTLLTGKNINPIVLKNENYTYTIDLEKRTILATPIEVTVQTTEFGTAEEESESKEKILGEIVDGIAQLMNSKMTLPEQLSLQAKVRNFLAHHRVLKGEPIEWNAALKLIDAVKDQSLYLVDTKISRVQLHAGDFLYNMLIHFTRDYFVEGSEAWKDEAVAKLRDLELKKGDLRRRYRPDLDTVQRQHIAYHDDGGNTHLIVIVTGTGKSGETRNKGQ